MLNGVIRICKSKVRLYNDEKKQEKKKNNDLQNTVQKIKDWTTTSPIKDRG